MACDTRCRASRVCQVAYGYKSSLAEADQKLFLYVLASNPNVKVDADAAATLFSKDGVVCTARAVQERMKKMKRQVAGDVEFASAVAYGDANAGTQTTPRTPASKKRGLQGTKSVEGPDKFDDALEEGNDTNEESPSKKMKSRVGLGKAVKAENFKKEPVTKSEARMKVTKASNKKPKGSTAKKSKEPKNLCISQEAFETPSGSENDEFLPEEKTPETANGKTRAQWTPRAPLTRWNPETDQELLLCIDVTLKQQGGHVEFYAAVAKLMKGNVTEGAINQHMGKIRKTRMEGDLPCPEPVRAAKGTAVARKEHLASTVAQNTPETPSPAKRRKGKSKSSTPPKKQPCFSLEKPSRNLPRINYDESKDIHKHIDKHIDSDDETDHEIQEPSMPVLTSSKPLGTPVSTLSGSIAAAALSTPTKQVLAPKEASESSDGQKMIGPGDGYEGSGFKASYAEAIALNGRKVHGSQGPAHSSAGYQLGGIHLGPEYLVSPTIYPRHQMEDPFRGPSLSQRFTSPANIHHGYPNYASPLDQNAYKSTMNHEDSDIAPTQESWNVGYLFNTAEGGHDFSQVAHNPGINLASFGQRAHMAHSASEYSHGFHSMQSPTCTTDQAYYHTLPNATVDPDSLSIEGGSRYFALNRGHVSAQESPDSSFIMHHHYSNDIGQPRPAFAAPTFHDEAAVDDEFIVEEENF
ncbi:MAG: hypothetical protein M1828_002479 [Chrysothrix sp. TS-e1954]|nr:MAG: hypothetical protein M1828_002479 [Chrysothrix sp. TS-e1954]